MWVLILFLLLCISQVVHADVYITTNSQGNIYDISPQQDCVVPAGDTRTDVNNLTMATLPIIQPYQNYNYINGGFSLNSTAVTAQQAAQQAAIAQATADANAKASAIAKLTDAISKVATQDVLTQQELQALLPQ